MDLEDFCDIMERHQPENLIVTHSERGSNDVDGGCSDHGDGPSNESAWGRENPQGGGGGGSGGGAGVGGGKVAFTREEVISNLVELFKEVGILNNLIGRRWLKRGNRTEFCNATLRF